MQKGFKVSKNGVKFTTEQLKGCLLSQFKFGRDLTIGYEGSQLVETAREGGVFTKMDFNGAPCLKDEFVEFMDANDSGPLVKYDEALAIMESIRQIDDRAHAMLDWWLFERGPGKSMTWVVERIGICERSGTSLLASAITEFEAALVNGPKFVHRPSPSHYLASAPVATSPPSDKFSACG